MNFLGNTIRNYIYHDILVFHYNFCSSYLDTFAYFMEFGIRIRLTGELVNFWNLEVEARDSSVGL